MAVAVYAFGIPLVVAVIAGIVTLIFEYWVVQPNFPNPPPVPDLPTDARIPWATDTTSANVDGGHVKGYVERVPDGRIFVSGTVEDIIADGSGVQLQVEAVDSSHQTDKKQMTNSEGANRKVGLREGDASGYFFPPDTKTIRVNECSTDTVNGATYVAYCGKAPLEIWRS